MYIKEMLELQRVLNNTTNGKIWITGKTKEGRIINWHRCIYMEAVEALDSFNWKHWKDINSLDDTHNIKIELIDIWHFVMSEIIRSGNQDYPEKYESIATHFEREELIASLEKIVYLASSYADITTICDKFFTALSYANISTEELYKHYMIKNVLNTFRQDHGYKNGRYEKIWNGKEDNEVAFDILQHNQSINAEDFYKELSYAYSKNTT